MLLSIVRCVKTGVEKAVLLLWAVFCAPWNRVTV
jgi:hypothetical protein